MTTSWRQKLGLPNLSMQSKVPYSGISLESMPADIVREIGTRMVSSRDILNLALTSSFIHSLLLPLLYTSVDLGSSQECRVTLSVLILRPHLIRQIRKLAVRPNGVKWVSTSNDHVDESWVANAIERMSRYLINLHTFLWNGDSLPPDQTWLTLRESCPRLRNLGLSVGSQAPSSDSNLFDFTGLTSFSLVFRQSLPGMNDAEQLPERLWDMLLNHSPLLEDLTFDILPSSSRRVDIRRLTSGQWPELRSLTLGGRVVLPDQFAGTAPVGPSFSDFVTAHPTLENLVLYRVQGWNSPAHLSVSSPTSTLPQFDSVGGNLRDVAGLSNSLSLKSIQLTSWPCDPSWAAPTCSRLASLTSLDIWLTCGDTPGNHHAMFRRLLTSCPHLLHLGVSCSSDPTFNIKEFSFALRYAPQLKSFFLTKVHKSNEVEMVRSAAQLALENPGLTHFTIRYANEWYWREEIRLKQVGTYHVASDTRGMPVSLSVHESGVLRRGKRYSRQYRYDLRPQPHVIRQKLERYFDVFKLLSK